MDEDWRQEIEERSDFGVKGQQGNVIGEGHTGASACMGGS